MIWALVEILVPLLIALGLGVFIGWLLFRWRRRLLHASEWNVLTANAQSAEIDLASAQAAHEETRNEGVLLASRLDATHAELGSAKSELDAATATSETLTRDIAARDAELKTLRSDIAARDTVLKTLHADLEAAENRLSSLNAELSGARAEVASTAARLGEAENTNTVAALAVQPAETDTRVSELESALTASRSELDASQSRLADLDTSLSIARADITAAHARIRELEVDVLSESDARGDGTTIPSSLAFVTEAPVSPSPQKLTVLGTVAGDHVDDLKVIRGIGPRMEQLLNGFEITSWEQLAALTEEEAGTVDEALSDFPGRIARDGWVDQARELVRLHPDIHNRPTRST